MNINPRPQCSCSSAYKEARGIALRLDNFIGDHPLGWMDELRKAVRESAPDGYIAGILSLSSALLDAASRHARGQGCALGRCG